MELFKSALEELKKPKNWVIGIVITIVTLEFILPLYQQIKDKARGIGGGGASALLALTLLLGSMSGVSAVPLLDLPSIEQAAPSHSLAATPANHEASELFAAVPGPGPWVPIAVGFAVLAGAFLLRAPILRLARKHGASFAGGFAAVMLSLFLGIGAMQTSWARDSVLNMFTRLEIRSGNEADVSTNGVLTIYGPSGTNKFSTLTNMQQVATFRALSFTGWTGTIVATNAAGGLQTNVFWNGLNFGPIAQVPTGWIF